MNYLDAKKMFETSRKRKLGNNTYLEGNDDGSFAIRLHGTQIVKFYPDKTVFNSDGYMTMTTKARINEFSDFYIIQQKGIWYFLRDSLGYKTPQNEWIVFSDNISYNHETNKWQGVGENPKKMEKLRKKVKQYAKDFVVALFAGKVPTPGAGDCFYCGMVVTSPAKDAGKSLGEVTDGDHILSHIDERYYVPSLCMNACKMFPVSKVAWWTLRELWEGKTASNCFADVAKDQIESSIKRYCYRQLKMA